MNKRINELIPVAISAIHNNMTEGNTIEVADTYKGYISSLSSSIVQSGLLVALSFYSEKPSKQSDHTNIRRNKMLDAIKVILLEKSLIRSKLSQLEFEEKEQKDLLTYTLKFIDPTYKSASHQYDFKYEHHRVNIIRNEIINAAIALKMGLRIFKMKKS